jgi:hypothetical protein
MPNECENWIRITGPQETLSFLQSKPFSLESWVPSPEHLNEEDKHIWIEEHWSTRWIMKVCREGGEAYLEKNEDGSLEARFLSAWCPPLAFYNTLAVRFPEIKLEYEYSEWGVGFAGHGIAKLNGEPIHYSYTSKEELDELTALRLWHLWIWNPHFDLESNTLSNSVCVN